MHEPNEQINETLLSRFRSFLEWFYTELNTFLSFVAAHFSRSAPLKKLGALRFQPRAAGWWAQALPLCNDAHLPQQVINLGSGGGEVVRAMASWSRGHKFESTWRQGFFLFFLNQWQSVLNQVPQERCIFAVFPISYTLSCVAWVEAGLNIHRMRI